MLSTWKQRHYFLTTPKANLGVTIPTLNSVQLPQTPITIDLSAPKYFACKMDEAKFDRKADEAIDDIVCWMEDISVGQNGIHIDADVAGRAQLIISDIGEWLLTKHSGKKEIWLSSPLSGGLTFGWKHKKWVNSDNIELKDYMEKELSQFF